MMSKLTPRRQAIFWAVLGAIMLLLSLWQGWFVLRFGGFSFPLAILAFLYAGLQLTIHLMARRSVATISDEELAVHGQALEEETPRILEMLEKGRSVTVVAEELEERRGLPPDVTHRYIIVLLGVLRQEQRELLVPRDPGAGE